MVDFPDAGNPVSQTVAPDVPSARQRCTRESRPSCHVTLGLECINRPCLQELFKNALRPSAGSTRRTGMSCARPTGANERPTCSPSSGIVAHLRDMRRRAGRCPSACNETFLRGSLAIPARRATVGAARCGHEGTPRWRPRLPSRSGSSSGASSPSRSENGQNSDTPLSGSAMSRHRCNASPMAIPSITSRRRRQTTERSRTTASVSNEWVYGRGVPAVSQSLPSRCGM